MVRWSHRHQTSNIPLKHDRFAFGRSHAACDAMRVYHGTIQAQGVTTREPAIRVILVVLDATFRMS